MNLALRQWRESFAQEPLKALDLLLCGRVSLGAVAQLSLGELLDLAFDFDDRDFDAALAEWLQGRILKENPDRMSSSRWSSILTELFQGIAGWELPRCCELFRTRHGDIRLWLRGLHEGPDRDPESAFLLALASRQTNRQFSTLWRRLMLGEELAGRDLLNIGMLGFRKMPNEEGKPNEDVPEGMLRALVELVDRHGTSKARWQRAVRTVFAAYPSREDSWVHRFREIQCQLPRKPEHLDSWLGAILAKWTKPQVRGGAKTDRVSSQTLPTEQERKNWVERIRQDPGLVDTEEGIAFLEHYRIYTRATGNPHYLVRTFNNVAVKIAHRDRNRAKWALGLMEEALDWDPQNPRNWTSYARVLDRANRRDEAIQALWRAPFRFPWDDVIRSELGRLLRESGDLDTSEAVLREAVAHFPGDVVCRTSLAETLRGLDKTQAAREVLEEACERFRSNTFCRTSLGELLIGAGEIDEAEHLYRQAHDLDPSNPYAATGLAKAWFVKSAWNKDEELREQARDLLQEFADRGNQIARSRLSHFDDWWAEGVEMGKDFRGSDTPGQPESRSEPMVPRAPDAMMPVERLGHAMAELWKAEHTEAPDQRDIHCTRALELLDVAEEPGELLTGFVETRGLVLLAQGEAKVALEYFNHQIEHFGRGGWIGIRLGEIRARLKLGETVDTVEAAELFDSRHTRYIFHVAEVIARLSDADPGHSELKALLKEIYPQASRWEPEPIEEDGDAYEADKQVAARMNELIFQFVNGHWFQPAHVTGVEDFDESEILESVVSSIRASQEDTLGLLQTASGIAS